MQFGVQLHPELGADAVIHEAQRADALGYDSVWLYDHLMNWAGVQTAAFPLETLTLAAAIGAGGLGVFIFRGVAMVSNSVILAGAIPAALLAVGVDLVLGLVERKLTP